MTSWNKGWRSAVQLGVLLPVFVACSGSEFASGTSNEGDASIADGGSDQDPNSSEDTDVAPPMPIFEASVIGGISILPPAGLITSEDGTQASFEVVLVNEPSAPVTIGLMSDAEDEGSANLSELTFDEDNWNVQRTVVITGLNDDDVDGDQPYNIITLPAVSEDPQYQGVDAADVSVVNGDNDAVDIRFEPSEGLVTTEAGGQANFTVRLSSKPSDDVALFLESSDPSEGQVSPAVLTFTADNWNSPRMVTVTGVDDEQADGATDYAVVVSNIISGDPNYGALASGVASVELSNTDDDSAGITVNGADLVVSEAGLSASFSVVLNREPGNEVILRVSSDDDSEGQVTPTLLTFTVDNWNAPQEVFVTGVDDADADGDVSFQVTLDEALSLDPSYNGLDVPDVAVTNLDNESAGFTVTPVEATVSEDGSAAAFELALNTQPSADVTIGVTVSDDSEGAVSALELTFTPDNWQSVQSITVNGVDDDETDGDQVFVVQTAPAESEDDDYRGLNPEDVTVLNLDNDTSGINVTPIEGLETSEQGGTAEFVVTLQTAPSSAVRVLLSSSDDSEGAVSPSQIDFDAENWSTPVPVLVSGVDDELTDGAQPFAIITELESEDVGYQDLLVADVAVLNRDDECPLPELVDDLEDNNLMLCPSQGRSGTWFMENAPEAAVSLMVQGAEREGSDFALRVNVDAAALPLPGAGEVLGPVLAANFSADAADPQAFDASAYSGVRLWVRSSPAAQLRVALVTSSSAQNQVTDACSFGCVGHFATTVAVGDGWNGIDLPFESFGATGMRDIAFDPSQLLGLKLMLQTSASYELWLDDVAFIPRDNSSP